MQLKYITLVFAFIYSISYTQDAVKYEIKDISDKYGIITQVVYTQIGNDSIKKIIDPVNYNPYSALEFPKKMYQFIGFEVEGYDLSNEDKYEIFNRFFSNSDYPDSLVSFLDFDFAYVETTIEIFQDYRFVIFSLKFFNKEFCILGVNTSAFVFSPDGSIFHKFSNLNYGFAAPVITNDLKYLAFLSVGDEFGYCHSALPQNTVLVYDIVSDEIVFKRENVDPPFVPKNCNYIVSSKYIKGGFQRIIIFPDKKVYYVKDIYIVEKKWIVRYEKDGVIIKDKKKNEEYKEFFEKSFIKEPF